MPAMVRLALIAIRPLHIAATSLFAVVLCAASVAAEWDDMARAEMTFSGAKTFL
jgi:hypothetical protein